MGDAYRAFFEYIAEDRPTFELLRRNAGTIRELMDRPALGAGVEELLEDLRAAIAAGEMPALDAEYMAAAMAGVGLEVGARMVERAPSTPRALRTSRRHCSSAGSTAWRAQSARADREPSTTRRETRPGPPRAQLRAPAV